VQAQPDQAASSAGATQAVRSWPEPTPMVHLSHRGDPPEVTILRRSRVIPEQRPSRESCRPTPPIWICWPSRNPRSSSGRASDGMARLATEATFLSLAESQLAPAALASLCAGPSA
jgi:hypothetical protein